jgi:hypothetical protein
LTLAKRKLKNTSHKRLSNPNRVKVLPFLGAEFEGRRENGKLKKHKPFAPKIKFYFYYLSFKIAKKK